MAAGARSFSNRKLNLTRDSRKRFGCSDPAGLGRSSQRTLPDPLTVAVPFAVDPTSGRCLSCSSKDRQLCPSRTPKSTQHSVEVPGTVLKLSLIHISEPTRLGMISYAVF